MNKFITGGLVALVAVFASTSIVVTPTVPTRASTNMPSSIIDGIEVPYDVLDYVQMKYQGYAVTGVSRVFLGGQQAYQLRADNEDVQNDNKSIVLHFDSKWKLIDDKQVVAPVYAPPPRSNDQESPKEEKPKEESKPEPAAQAEEIREEVEEQAEEIQEQVEQAEDEIRQRGRDQ